MKKLLYTLAALAAMVVAASCEQEKLVGPDNSDLVEVTFNVAMPDAVATKGISDGTKATELLFFAFDGNGKYLEGVKPATYPVAVSGYNAAVTVKLIKGMTYSFVFWAQKPGQYTSLITATNGEAGLSLDISTIVAGMMNTDDFDAFYGRIKDYKVEKAFSTETLYLTRPFAQLNVGAYADDIAAAQASNIETGADVMTTKYFVGNAGTFNVNTTMNLMDGTVGGGLDVNFTAKTRPAETLVVDQNYTWISMLYLLLGNPDYYNSNLVFTDVEENKTVLTEVDFNISTTQNGDAVTTDRNVYQVPVQRNYRTNILGNIFSVEGTFNIKVDNKWATGATGADETYIPEYADIDALNAAFANTTASDAAKWSYKVKLLSAGTTKEIKLPDTTDPVDIVFADGAFASEELTISYASDDAAKPTKLTIKVDALAKLTANLPQTHIDYTEGTITTAIITSSNTTFVIMEEAEVVNLTILGGGLKVEGDLGTGLVDEGAGNVNVVLADGATVGELVMETGNLTVEPGSTIETKVDVYGSGTVTVSNTDEAADLGKINYGTYVNAVNEDGPIADKDQELGNELPELIKTEAALRAAIAANVSPIVLAEDITSDDGYIIDHDVEINLNGKTLTVNVGSNANSRAIRVDNGTLTIHGGTIVAVGAGTTSSNGTGCYGAFRVEADGKLIASDMTLQNARPWGLNVKVLGGEATLTNVTINSSYGGGIEVTEADLGTQSQAGKATLNNCTFTQAGFYDHCSTALSVSGGSELVINSGTYTSENYALYVFSSGGFITVNGGTFVGNKNGIAIIAQIDTNTYPQYEGGLKLKGGDFTGGFSIVSPASLEISGGTYSVDPSEYVVAGKQAQLNTSTNKWEIVDKVQETGTLEIVKTNVPENANANDEFAVAVTKNSNAEVTYAVVPEGAATVTPGETAGAYTIKAAQLDSDTDVTITFSVAANDDFTAASDNISFKVLKYVAPINYTTIADLKALITADDTTFDTPVTLGTVIVTAVKGKNVWLEDNSGAILLFLNNHGLEAGKSYTGAKVSGGTFYNTLYEITTFDVTDATVAAATIPVTEITVAQLLENFSAYESRRVKLSGVTVTTEVAGTDKTVPVTQGDAATNLFIRYEQAIKVESVLNVTGNVSKYNGKAQIAVFANTDVTEVTPGITTTKITGLVNTTINQGEEFDFSTVVSANVGTVTYNITTKEGVSLKGSTVSVASNATVGETVTITANVARVDGDHTAAEATATITVGEADSNDQEPVVLIIDGATLTGTATSEAKDYTYKDSANNEFTITLSAGAKVQSSSGDNKFTDKAILIGKSGAYIYNKTAIPGTITKFEIYANKGASAKVSVGVNFSSSAISEYNEKASNTYTETLSTVDKVYDCSSVLPSDAKYFWYQVTNANNSQVEFRITYIPSN